MDLTHFSHANLQLSTHLSYCGQLFFSKANTICSYASENKITWAISSHASRHKLTTVEVRKKSQHSQQIGASTPSPIASGSEGTASAGQILLRWRSGLYEAFSMTGYCCTYQFVFLLKPSLRDWHGLLFILGWVGSCNKNRSHRKSVAEPEVKTQLPYPGHTQKNQNQFSILQKSHFNESSPEGLANVADEWFNVCSSEQIPSTMKPKSRDSILLLLVLSSVTLCANFYLTFPTEINWNLQLKITEALYVGTFFIWHDAIDLLYCRGGNVPLPLPALCPDGLCHGQDECCTIIYARWLLFLGKTGWIHCLHLITALG